MCVYVHGDFAVGVPEQRLNGFWVGQLLPNHNAGQAVAKNVKATTTVIIVGDDAVLHQEWPDVVLYEL
jgi:hypothetical protein